MRLLALCLIAVLAAGCDPFGRLPDGEQIDSVWVGAEGDCETVEPGFCAAVFRCSVEAEFGGADPGILSWRMHAPPDRLRDGTLVTRGGAVTIVVFELADGTRRATQVFETDRCR